MVIIFDIAFYAATYNNIVNLILPAIRAHDDVAASTQSSTAREFALPA